MKLLFISLLLYLFEYNYVQCQTCSATQECTNKACCSKFGNCGYGPNFCGTGCLSNCNAKAECGQYGVQKLCPLNVCCSQYGFCGTTSDFCDISKKCQNNCGDKQLPECSNNQNNLIQVGYYASWAASRPCQTYKSINIDPRDYTHLNYAFGKISNGVMINPDAKEENNMKQFVALKQINSNLKVLISVGGWAFNDPGPTRNEFHNIISTDASRKRFIISVTNYLKKYQFDGIDIDYEYPAANDRGGSPEDTDNYVKLVKDMRSAFGNNYMITIAAPASYWYLRHFKIGEMSKYIDFINVMTYDIHGTWDSDIASLGPYVKSHTNIQEITEAFKLFLRDGVNTNKLVLGLGYYGRSFTLDDPSCKKVGCKFKGPGKPGPCTKTPGVLAWFEIEDIITKNQLTPTFDQDSMSKILVWNRDQWVAYDDEETLAMRRQYAAKHCLKGVMIWSIDQGINVVSDNRKSLSRNGQINYVTMNIIYHQIDSKTFAFQIDGNADARYDYQIFSLAKYTKSGMTQTTREKRQPNQCNPPGNHAIYVVGTLVINTILQEIYQRLIQNPNQIRRIRPNDPNNPIQESIVRQLPRGLFAHTERVEFVIARITPRHYNPNNRVDFPSSGSTSTQYMRTNLNALAGDERGHIVASVFGGPPVAYNMFPQHRSLNRNYRASHILVDWFEAEARIRQHLGNNRGDVQWEVALSYDDLNTGRPTSVSFSATFYDRNGAVVDRLEGTLRNCEGSMTLPNGRSCGF